MLTVSPEIPLAERHTYSAGRAVPLVAMLGSVGHSYQTTPEYDWHGLKRGRAEFALVQYTLAGRGAMTLEGREYAILPGTAMLLSFPANNRYWLPEDSTGWEFIYLCLYGAEVMRVWSRAMRVLGPLPSLPPDHPVIRQVADLVRDALASEFPTPFEASARVYALLMALLAEVAAASRATAASPHAEALERARRLGQKRFAEALGVDDLARAAGLSRYHFTRLFTAQTGIPPAAWLVDLRVKEAARLLRETQLPLKEISARCGFVDPSYLGKVFRQRTGQPPRSYRHSGV